MGENNGFGFGFDSDLENGWVCFVRGVGVGVGVGVGADRLFLASTSTNSLVRLHYNHHVF